MICAAFLILPDEISTVIKHETFPFPGVLGEKWSLL